MANEFDPTDPENFTAGMSKATTTTHDFSNFHYPIDLLGANNEYGGNYIVFYINVQEGTTLSATGRGADAEYVPDGVKASTSGHRSDLRKNTYTKAQVQGASAVMGAVGGGIVGEVVSTGSIGGAIAGGLVGAGAAELIMQQTGTLNRATKRLKSAIALHVPHRVSIRYNTDWSGIDTAGQQMLLDGVDVIQTAAESGLQEAWKKAKEKGIGALTNMVLANAPQKGILSAMTGMAANSKKEMIFSGVDMRAFTFDYRFTPRNREELRMVQNIIKMFKFHMHPEFVQGSNNYVYKYPSEFDIVFYNNGNINPHLHRYTSCVLKNMAVDSTPGGFFSAFGGNIPDSEGRGSSGAPTEIAISLDFQELAILTKQEIADGY